MKMHGIREIDHTIQPTIALDQFEAPNEFIASLVTTAVRDGSATMEDAEGCPVTAAQAVRLVAAHLLPHTD